MPDYDRLTAIYNLAQWPARNVSDEAVLQGRRLDLIDELEQKRRDAGAPADLVEVKRNLGYSYGAEYGEPNVPYNDLNVPLRIQDMIAEDVRAAEDAITAYNRGMRVTTPRTKADAAITPAPVLLKADFTPPPRTPNTPRKAG